MNGKLEYIYRQIPSSTCPADCGKCCGILFPSKAELRNIQDWCEDHSIEYIDLNMNPELDCPYLSEAKKCMIYPVRPFLCRLVGVSEDLPCPLGRCLPQKLLNHSQCNFLYKSIYLHGKEKRRIEKHRKLLANLLREVTNETSGSTKYI